MDQCVNFESDHFSRTFRCCGRIHWVVWELALVLVLSLALALVLDRLFHHHYYYYYRHHHYH